MKNYINAGNTTNRKNLTPAKRIYEHFISMFFVFIVNVMWFWQLNVQNAHVYALRMQCGKAVRPWEAFCPLHRISSLKGQHGLRENISRQLRHLRTGIPYKPRRQSQTPQRPRGLTKRASLVLKLV